MLDELKKTAAKAVADKEAEAKKAEALAKRKAAQARREKVRQGIECGQKQIEELPARLREAAAEGKTQYEHNIVWRYCKGQPLDDACVEYVIEHLPSLKVPYEIVGPKYRYSTRGYDYDGNYDDRVDETWYSYDVIFNWA